MSITRNNKAVNRIVTKKNEEKQKIYDTFIVQKIEQMAGNRRKHQGGILTAILRVKIIC